MSGFDDRHDDDDDPPFFSRGNSSDVNSRILFIAIISLSVVVVVVTMLHVYARYILRRQARRRVALQGVGFIIPIQSPKSGLEPMVIASLPAVMYKEMNHEQGLISPECTVCLGVFEADQMIRTLPNCKHHFHAECIDKWLGSHSSCPICRHEVEPSAAILALPREPSTRLGVIGPGAPSAPPLEQTSYLDREGIPDERIQSSAKVNGTSSRLSSFRRMLSMDRSSRRVNSCTQDNGPDEDLERQ